MRSILTGRGSRRRVRVVPVIRSLGVVLVAVCLAVVVVSCGAKASEPLYHVGDCLHLEAAHAASAYESKTKPVPCTGPRALSKIVNTGAPAACKGSQRVLKDPGDTNVLYCVAPQRMGAP
jgi:hypothetical protein